MALLARLDFAALQALRDRGQPIVVQEVIAKSVIEVACTGDRDPDRLAHAALEKLGLIDQA